MNSQDSAGRSVLGTSFTVQLDVALLSKLEARLDCPLSVWPYTPDYVLNERKDLGRVEPKIPHWVNDVRDAGWLAWESGDLTEIRRDELLGRGITNVYATKSSPLMLPVVSAVITVQGLLTRWWDARASGISHQWAGVKILDEVAKAVGLCGVLLLEDEWLIIAHGVIAQTLLLMPEIRRADLDELLA